MKIVVLDGRVLNPGDLSWDGLKALGDCTIYERTPPEEVISRAKDAEIALTNKTKLPREIIEQLPKLKYIGAMATGYDVVDVEAARDHNIPVTNVPTYATQSVAQLVFAHLLNLVHHTADHTQSVSDGRWVACEDFSFWDYPLIELVGLTMGIIGFGRIGKATSKLALAFGMKVLACDILEMPQPEGVRFVDHDTIFRESDVITMHVLLTPDTRGLVNKRNLALMKESAFLINTSRGPVVDEQALADALNSGRIAGAGLDVLSVEPPVPDNPVLTAKNCFITPHIAWATSASRARLMDTVVSNVKAFLENRLQNTVT
jgi:glycerate dehydrogenase